MRVRTRRVHGFSLAMLVAVMSTLFAITTADTCCIQLFGQAICGDGTAITAPGGGGIAPGPTATPFVNYTDHTTREDSNAWQGGSFSSTTTTDAYVTDSQGTRFPYSYDASRIRRSESCDFSFDQTKADQTNLVNSSDPTQFTVSAGYATGSFPDIKCPLSHAILTFDIWTQDDDNPSIHHDDVEDIHCHDFGGASSLEPCGDPSQYVYPDF